MHPLNLLAPLRNLSAKVRAEEQEESRKKERRMIFFSRFYIQEDDKEHVDEDDGETFADFSNQEEKVKESKTKKMSV